MFFIITYLIPFEVEKSNVKWDLRSFLLIYIFKFTKFLFFSPLFISIFLKIKLLKFIKTTSLELFLKFDFS